MKNRFTQNDPLYTMLNATRAFMVLLALMLTISIPSQAENVPESEDVIPSTADKLEQKLFRAVWSGDTKRVASLLNDGLDPNTKVPLKGDAYRTLIYDATYKGYATVVKVLLGFGADPNAQNSNGKTALHLASQRGMDKIAEMLLNTKANTELRAEDGSTPIIYAALGGHIDLVRLLITYGADVNAHTSRTERTALHMAATKGFTNIVKLLAEHGAHLNALDGDQCTALALAAMSGSPKTVDALLSGGADPDAGTCPPLLYAAEGGYEKIARSLLEHKADINRMDDDGSTALMEAAQGGHTNTLRLLLKNGADPSLTDSLGLTALHHASDAKTTALLLRYKAPLDARDENSNTPLSLAALNAQSVQCPKCEEKAEVLAEHGADLLAKNDEGDEIIHAAAIGGIPWLVEQCLDAGANINARDIHGRTPLHHVASLLKAAPDLIRFLVIRGADINAIDNDGKTPLDLAAELPPERGQESLDVLVEFGAQSGTALRTSP